MTQYFCKNFGGCDKADQRQPLEVALGSDARCPECRSALHATGSGSGTGPTIPTIPTIPTDHTHTNQWKKVGMALGGLLLVGGGVAGYVLSQGKGAEAPKVASAPAPAPVPSASQPADVSTGPGKPSECIVASTAQGTVQARIDQHSQQAEEALKKGQSGDARQATNHALALQLVKSAIANLGQGRLADAEADLATARERDPDEPLVDYNLAIVRLRQAQPEAALKSLEQAFCKGFKAFEEMDKDTDLAPLRSNPAFAKLVSQYRPS